MAIDMKKEKIEKEKETKKDIKKEIPNEVKQAFGKFYTFSIVLVLLTLFVMIFVKKLELWFLITFLVIALGFYIYMLFNLFKNRNRFMSSFVILDIMVFVIVYSLLLLKILGLS